MVTENPVQMLSEIGIRPVIGGSGGGESINGEDLEKELGLYLREKRRQDAIDRERELNLFRSGSAPPTVEGSLAAVGGLFGGGSAFGVSDCCKNGNGFLSEEELRSDPAYLAYYYSNVNLNPRLPPPVLSKEDWRFAQRLQAGGALGGIGDRRKGNGAEEGGSRSLFSQHLSGFNVKEEGEAEARRGFSSGQWLDRGGDGLIGLSLGGRKKSFAEIFQDDLGNTTPVSSYPSRPASRNAFDGCLETLGSVESQISRSHSSNSYVDVLQACGKGQNGSGVQPIGPSASPTFASVVGGSLSRSATPDPQLVRRVPSPCLPPVGVRIGGTEKKVNNGSSSINSVSPNVPESVDIVGAFSDMNLSKTSMVQEDNYHQSSFQQEYEMQGRQNNIKQHPHLKKSDSGRLSLSSTSQSVKPLYHNFSKSSGIVDVSNSVSMSEDQVFLQSPSNSSASSYLKGPFAPPVTIPIVSPAYHQNSNGSNATFTGCGQSGYSVSMGLPNMLADHIGAGNLPLLFENAAASAIGYPGLHSRAPVEELQNLNGFANHAAAAGLHVPVMDPLYLEYLRTAEYAAQIASSFDDPLMDGNYGSNAYMGALGLQKAYLASLLSSQKQYGIPILGKSGNLNHGHYGNSSPGLGMSYMGGALASPVIPGSPVGHGGPFRHGERTMHYPSGMRNLSGGLMGSWHPDSVGNIAEGFAPSLLDEFKSNKTQCFELSEISGHVVEFSADQYGSRFIQQKLETATSEEKDMVFEEIIPQALSLMTDVFGNYVVQKFFEHGSAAQIRELADQLTGHVLTLSLQMYGCRVIQKAVEVVDLDQQTKMVAELDGHILRCVRDQNGNHVIQKCIECIPQDSIQFIISSFYDQVVTLSTHPYGCRVIQRVLEHCDDPKTQQIVMDEIFQNVCMLAQDQYGNYVVQHVLEHGKPHERSAIIKKLAGQIVQMSQQKFASNVVEKCLTFGGPIERQILVNEILGTTDENEPLQAMMKDQFANYVVQKVLETCDDQQRELILSRIKVHLNALKKYTYGKHIVARVEKLVAAGERRMGVQSPYIS